MCRRGLCGSCRADWRCKGGGSGCPVFAGGATGGGGGGTFYPVVGLVVPLFNGTGGRGGGAAGEAPARVIIDLGDETTMDFNYRLLKATREMPMHTLLERVTALRTFAVSEVGESQADNLIEAWSSLNDAEGNLNVLNFGGMLRFGHVLNRWITRPMVPFPEELTLAGTAGLPAVSVSGQGRGAGRRLRWTSRGCACMKAGGPGCCSSTPSS